jgi:hypothetical protein
MRTRKNDSLNFFFSPRTCPRDHPPVRLAKNSIPKTQWEKLNGEKSTHISWVYTYIKLSTSLANVIFRLHLTMKSFFCGVVNFSILSNKDLPHFVLTSSSRSYFLHVVAEVEKVV